MSIVNKCHNIRREKGACGKWEPTHTALTAHWLKQREATCYGIQRGKTDNGYRKECAEIKKKKLKILMVAVRVERRPQCREIGGTEDSRKTGSQLQS